MKKEKELQGYYQEAASWDIDRVYMSERSRRIAWRIAIASMVLTAASVLALVSLTPLKRVEPFVVRVDNTTGVVDIVPVYTGQADAGETVTRYLLAHYVQVCERFNFSTAESDYTECGAFHSAQRNQAWYESWNKNNPNSPLNLYRDGSTVRAQVNSISFFQRGSGVSDLAQVRYTRAKRQAGAAEEQLTHWIATIQYTYAEPSKDPAVRRWNPLGFKIVDYRPEPEVTDTASAKTASAPGVLPDRGTP